MKKKNMLMVALAMLMLMMSGCGAATTTAAEAESDVTAETAIVEETEDAEPEETSEETPDETEDAATAEEIAYTYAYTITELSETRTVIRTANLRAMPSISGEKLTSLASGTSVTVTGICEETGWYRVECAGIEGYVSPAYLDAATETEEEADEEPESEAEATNSDAEAKETKTQSTASESSSSSSSTSSGSSSSSSSNSSSTHAHNLTLVLHTDPSCYIPECFLYECECGYWELVEGEPETGHNWEYITIHHEEEGEWVTMEVPIYTDTTVYICNNCWEFYSDDSTKVASHTISAHGCGGWTTNYFLLGYETQEVWIMTAAAYDESYYECTRCGLIRTSADQLD